MASSRLNFVLAIAAVIAAACSDAPTVTCSDQTFTAYTHTFDVDDFPYADGVPGLELEMVDGDPPAARTLAVVFAPAPEPFRDGDNDAACPLLADDVSASIEGVTGTPGEAGGWQCRAAGGAICGRTTLVMDLPAALRDPDASIGITDRTGTRSIPLADALVERTITPVGITDWTFHANQTVTFRWSPASDVTVLTEQLFAYLMRADGTSIPITDGCVVSGPGAIACTIPPGNTGEGLFALDLTGRIEQSSALVRVHRVVQHTGKIVP